MQLFPGTASLVWWWQSSWKWGTKKSSKSVKPHPVTAGCQSSQLPWHGTGNRRDGCIPEIKCYKSHFCYQSLVNFPKHVLFCCMTLVNFKCSIKINFDNFVSISFVFHGKNLKRSLFCHSASFSSSDYFLSLFLETGVCKSNLHLSSLSYYVFLLYLT